jgi:hypothetical protein
MTATKKATKTATKTVATKATSKESVQDQIRSAIDNIESSESMSGHDYAPMALTGLRKAIVWLDRIEGDKDK